MSRTSVLVVAAGAGKRFGGPKQFAYLQGKPVLEWTLERFQAHDAVDDIVLVLPDEQDMKHYRLRYPKIVDIVRGGEKRQDSVWQGFRLLKEVGDRDRPRPRRGPAARRAPTSSAGSSPRPGSWGRPCRSCRSRRRSRRSGTGASSGRSTGPGSPGPRRPRASSTRSSSRPWSRPARTASQGTDEASLAERAGIPVGAVDGEPRNIKITTPVDLKIAEALLDA
ncbi:MAG: 2-C-methyl-D-erythritol 4-phosphate cytidylyltransferase [Anaerotruncus sp.]|nr:2-C-methyl-D-erythritol 4-phosphate cytidylyltransferase [Anaerotruncus sp.]